MAAKPWYAWYPSDYRAATSHLDYVHDCAYRRLLDLYYDRGNRGGLTELSTDGNRGGLYRAVGALSDAERAAVDAVLSEFFIIKDNNLINERAEKELLKQAEIRLRLSNAGKRGGNMAGRGRPIEKNGKVDRPSIGKATVNLKTLTTNPTPTPSLNPPLSAKSPGFSIPLADGSEFTVPATLVAEFDKLYPAVDVPQTLREIRAWNIANPQHRKTTKGILRHINQWLAKEQNNG